MSVKDTHTHRNVSECKRLTIADMTQFLLDVEEEAE